MLQILIVVSFILAIIGMVRFKRLTVPFKILSLYLVFEGFMYLFDKWEISKYRNNIIYAHIDIACTYIFFGLIYY